MATPDGTVMEEPLTIEERIAHARHCKAALGLGPIPALVDELDDPGDRAYEAWPDRLFLLDAEGRIAWRSGPGPFGFDLDALAAALQQELARTGADSKSGDDFVEGPSNVGSVVGAGSRRQPDDGFDRVQGRAW